MSFIISRKLSWNEEQLPPKLRLKDGISAFGEAQLLWTIREMPAKQLPASGKADLSDSKMLGKQLEGPGRSAPRAVAGMIQPNLPLSLPRNALTTSFPRSSSAWRWSILICGQVTVGERWWDPRGSWFHFTRLTFWVSRGFFSLQH